MHGLGAKSILTNTAYLSSTRVITSVAQAIYVVFMAKLLGAELYGLFNYGLSWYLVFFPISALGIDTILIRGIGRDRSKAGLLIGQTLALRSASSLTIGLLSFLVGYYVEPDSTSRLLLLVFSFALVGRSLSLWSNSVFVAHESSGYVMGLEVVFRLLEVVIGLSALLAGFGVIEIAIIHAAVWLLQGIAGQILIRRYLLSISLTWDFPALAGLLRDGIPFVLSAFLSAWLMQGPIIIYRQVLGFGADLGQLALALQALFLAGMTFSEISGPALPVLSRSVDGKDGKTGMFVDLMLRAGMLIGGVLAVMGFTIGARLIDLLFGGAYQYTAYLLPWTLMLVTPFFWSSTLTAVLASHGRYWSLAFCRTLGAMVFTLCALLMVTGFGMPGVVAALGAGLVSISLCQLLILGRYYEVDFARLVGRTLITVLGPFLIAKALAPFGILLSLTLGITSLIIFARVTGTLKKGEFESGCRILSAVIKGR